MSNKLDRATHALGLLAQRQHGVVTAVQLVELGISRATVTAWTKRGRLHRLHRGVYAVGHAAPSEARAFMAAVLVCGEGAALSHLSAAVLWKFLTPHADRSTSTAGGPVHVTSPSTNGRASKRGVVLHVSPSLKEKGMVTKRYRIPVTSPRRTIEDLEGCVDSHIFRRAKRQAEFMKYRLKLPTDRSRSDLESDFLRFLAQHRFSRPEVNVKLGRYTVDFLWRSEKVVVETDFFDYHRGSVAFEDDHQRELELRRIGYTVRRFTGAQIRDYPDLVVADLGEVLRREAGSPS